MSSTRRPVVANAVIVITLTVILWGALFPGLAIAGVNVAAVLFPFVALTLFLWGALIYDVVSRVGTSNPPRAPSRVPEVQRAFAALGQLESALRGASDLPDVLSNDVRQAVDTLKDEAARERDVLTLLEGSLGSLRDDPIMASRGTMARERLTAIAGAAEDFSRQLTSVGEPERSEDAVERLRTARRALDAVAREVR